MLMASDPVHAYVYQVLAVHSVPPTSTSVHLTHASMELHVMITLTRTFVVASSASAVSIVRQTTMTAQTGNGGVCY